MWLASKRLGEKEIEKIDSEKRTVDLHNGYQNLSPRTQPQRMDMGCHIHFSFPGDSTFPPGLQPHP